MNRRIWLVGGSSGIGLELLKLLLLNDYEVILSSRHASSSENLLALESEFPRTLKLLDMDVADAADVKEKTVLAYDAFDGLDLWFYNAGAYEVMSLAQWNLEHFEQMNEVNYLGAVRIMNALLPYFKTQGSGRWVWNLSLSSYFGLPLGGGYSAPKAALMNLAEALQPELLQEGIELQIINHGFVKTRLTAKNSFEMPQLMEPSEAAEKIFEGLNKAYRFEIRFPFKLGLFLRMLRFLPYKIALRLTQKMLP